MTNPTKERNEKIRPQKVRLDKLLVDQGHAASRERAQALILAGRVLVDEQRIDKPGTSISATAPTPASSPPANSSPPPTQLPPFSPWTSPSSPPPSFSQRFSLPSAHPI